MGNAWDSRSLFIFGIPSREISPKAELQGEYGQPYDDEDYYEGMFESHNVWRYFTHLGNRVDYRHALPIDPIPSTYRACPAVHRRADGVGQYCDACLELRSVIAGV